MSPGSERQASSAAPASDGLCVNCAGSPRRHIRRVESQRLTTAKLSLEDTEAHLCDSMRDLFHERVPRGTSAACSA